MDRERLLHILAGFIFLLLAVHYGALFFSLYWSVWWFDLIVHFAGGAWVGLFALWLLYLSGYIRLSVPQTTDAALLVALCTAVVVGALWELFEYVMGVPTIEPYVLDTMLDMVMDTLGGFAAGVWYGSMMRRSARL